ncbi:hypothetical protein RYZ26_01525 [Terasakiella sp. A23]|uniref:hypothetical protein n=1 Tax=Terasakiella sp. FCG-A23 TaxID=3080561 RepID=UPI0029552E23|nr:hypothetical protein [Terasakiella sp. A23]MDV7338256.1 hypothetical protein [Terasakiella sp. A23]
MHSILNTYNCKLLSLLSILIIVGLTGCVGREKPVLSLTAKHAINSSEIFLNNKYADLKADIQGSNATQIMGGGLLWAAADIAAMTVQRNQQQELMAPILAEIKDVNLQNEIREKNQQCTCHFQVSEVFRHPSYKNRSRHLPVFQPKQYR